MGLCLLSGNLRCWAGDAPPAYQAIDDAEEAAAFASALRELHWVPSVSSPTSPYLPWPVELSAASRPSSAPQSTPVVLCPLSRPVNIRPSAEQWLCSATVRILDGDVSTVAMRNFLQFDTPVSYTGDDEGFARDV